MKKDYKDTCAEIRLWQSKLADNENTLTSLRQTRDQLHTELAIADKDFAIDSADCLPLRDELSIDTRGAPIIKIPIMHSS